MRSMRRNAILLVLGLALVVAGTVAAADFITLGTSTVGGSYYLYGGGIASYFQNNMPSLMITAQTTRGSYENMRLIGNRLNMAMANSQAVWERYNGTETFKAEGADKDIRGVMALDNAAYHWVVIEGKGINKIEDFVGKTISIGEAGSGSEAHAIMVLEAMGILDKVKLQRLGYGASATALRDGQIAGFVGASALPMPTVVDLASNRKIKLLPEGDDLIAKMLKTKPSYRKVTIPAGTYSGVNYPVTVLASVSMIVADRKVSDDVVYKFVKTLFTKDARAYMKNVYNAWDPDPADEVYARIGVPLHPGAVKYYKEAGLMK